MPEKYLQKYQQYEEIYQSKLRAFQAIDNRNNCILNETVSDEDRDECVGDVWQFLSKYELGEQLGGDEFNFSFVSRTAGSESKQLIMKRYDYKSEGLSEYAVALLCRCIAAKKIGIIEDGDIYDDIYNHKLRLILKYWNADLATYISRITGDNNMFRRTETLAVFMKDIV